MTSSFANQNVVDRVKGPWSSEEDILLTNLVQHYGPRNWSAICKHIPGRTSKSCRLRWCNQLSPNVDHHPFTKEEDETIIRAHVKYGIKWAAIARMLSGRTDNSVKNRWHSTLSRKFFSSVNKDFGGVGGSAKPSKRPVTTGSGASVLPSGNYIQGNTSKVHVNNSVGPHVFRPVARVGSFLGPSTSLSISLPGLCYTKSPTQLPPLRIKSPLVQVNSPLSVLNRGGFGSPSMMASVEPVVASMEPVVEPAQQAVNGVNEQDQTCYSGFDGDFIAVMKEVVSTEVRNFMAGFELQHEQQRFNQVMQQQRQE